MKITQREFIKSQAAMVAAAPAGVTLPASITAVAAEGDEGVRWDKAPCRFCVTGERRPTGAHAFDRGCADNRIEQRLTKPRTPQTNGMIERFNGRIADVLRTHRFDSSASLQATLKRFVYLYNHHIPHKGLHHQTPLQTLQKWYAQQPQLFKKIPHNHPGPDK